MSSSIGHLFFLLLAFLLLHPFPGLAVAQPAAPNSRITVVGVVFCDTCSTNAFSRHSYFLPGVDVHIQCKFKASSPKTAEQISFSVNRTTDRYGVYKLEIPHVDGVDCVDGMAIESLCQASLIGSSSATCNLPGLKTATNEISVKSKQDSLCIYSLRALSYRPSERNATLCGKQKQESEKAKALSSSEFLLPYYFPSYGFLWPPFPFPFPFPPPFPRPPPSFPFPPLFPSPPPSFPFPPLFPSPPPSFPFPPLFPSPPPSFPFPPLFPSPPPSFPFPPLFPSPPPSFPFPPLFPSPPSLPFPFPPLPKFPPVPTLFQPPPPPAFNLRDPRTWIPNVPALAPPPPPPAFNLRDPRTWIPNIPPSPPGFPQNQDQQP